MTLLLVLVAIAVVGAVAVLVVRDRPILADDPSATPALGWDREAEDLPAALDRVRFTIAVRGYRMDQVDRVLDDLARTLGEQQARIAQLEADEEPVESPALAEPDVDPLPTAR